MKKIKIKKSQLLIYFFILIMFLVLSNAKIGTISPFGFGAVFALMWTGFYMPLIVGEYLFANLLTMDKLADLYCAIGTVFILIIAYIIHKKVKKPMNVVLVGVYALLSQIVSLYYIFNIGSILDMITYIAIGLIFLYVCICIFQLLVLRGWTYKLTLDETISLVVFIIALTFGVANLYIFEIAIYKFLAVFTILFCISINKKQFSLIAAISIGLGVSIVNSSLSYIGELAIIALMANIFHAPHRWKFCITALIGDVALQLYFLGVQVDVIYSILPTLLAISLFLLIPSKFLLKIMDKYEINNAELSVKNIINSTRKNLKRRMSELSNVFSQMEQIHMQLIKKELSHAQIVEMLSNELGKEVCSECKHKNSCYKGLGAEGVPYVNKMLDIALKKGKISILDLPSMLAQKCGVVNLVIGKINQYVSQYKNYENMSKETNNVKFLLAEQMGAISHLLLDLGEEMDRNIVFENDMESKILNRMLAQNIVCSEILIYSEKSNDSSVVAIIKGENAYNPSIEKIVSGVLNIPMKVVSVEPTDVSEYFSVTLSRSCKRDIVFGIGSRTKTGSSSSGDSHSLLRLGNNKYLLALCDGMGSGENARKMSALTIGLVENFYKAGFDDNFILENINKLISINNQESFSTLDLCIIDLTKEIIDFIKIGATYGIIKREKEVEKVENGTLPLGVLSEIKPTISHFAINSKDMIVMVTDGITDTFKTYEEFAEFVNAIVSTNPQVVAQTILDEAISRNNMIAQDDMTVLVARTFLKG